MKLIDPTNMCSHLQRKLFAPDGEYRAIREQIENDPTLIAVGGHMFCFFDLNDFQVISLKCQPERIDELKAQYDCVGNPYNESPKHWIGLDPRTSPDALTKDLIRNSYEIVKAKYNKKK